MKRSGYGRGTLISGMLVVLMLKSVSAGQGAHGSSGDYSGMGFSQLPDKGQLPAIADLSDVPSEEELAKRAAVREYRKQIGEIRHKYFGEVKVEKLRKKGISLLSEFVDPAAFTPLLEELKGEKDDVRLAVLDHLAEHGDEGQAALAWEAIYDGDSAIRNEARKRLKTPIGKPVLRELNSALRSANDQVANHAARVAVGLNVTQTIPLLIFAQGRPDQPGTDKGQGDLAWIAIETQRAYVVSLTPVAGDSSGAFAPVIGTVSDGTLVRVVDAVAVVYRTEVHDSLVAMTTADWGQSTAKLDYNVDDWWHWYNEVYVPFKQEQREAQASELGSE
ncbi:MAG TPA: hypothetical protein VG711_09550 [Phycisphaerales bacterium]|nr:hypothetical protein [Phycisphaerales bacterium]